jgi:hypothetical protein
MGYFGAAIILLEKPNWTKLDELPDSIAIRGYEYRHGTIWAIDFWKPTKKAHEYAFMNAKEHKGMLALPATEDINSFSQMVKTLSDAETYGEGWVRLTLAVARMLGQSVYFFAGDDEAVDMACHCDPAGLRRLACGFDPYDVRYADGQWSVTPRRYLENEGTEASCSARLLEELRKLPNTKVTEPVDIEGGSQFYGHAASEWPKEAGDPIKVMGVGSWDVFENVKEDFQQVFERIAESAPQPKSPVVKSQSATQSVTKRPWWKFW